MKKIISIIAALTVFVGSVRADEGIIVKKASEGFREYVMQTGELPFPVPV